MFRWRRDTSFKSLLMQCLQQFFYAGRIRGFRGVPCLGHRFKLFNIHCLEKKILRLIFPNWVTSATRRPAVSILCTRFVFARPKSKCLPTCKRASGVAPIQLPRRTKLQFYALHKWRRMSVTRATSFFIFFKDVDTVWKISKLLMAIMFWIFASNDS